MHSSLFNSSQAVVDPIVFTILVLRPCDPEAEISRHDWNAWDLNIADLNSVLAPEDEHDPLKLLGFHRKFEVGEFT